jgi:hypothetical protein
LYIPIFSVTFLEPILCKPHFTICTIHSINPFVSKWFHEIVRWSICVFSHNLKNCMEFYTLVREYFSWKTKPIEHPIPNAYYYSSLLWSNNGTNSNHLKKCSIVTKTYQLCHIIKFNGLVKSKLHQYPNSMMGNGCK